MNVSISFFYYVISFIILLYFKFFGQYVNECFGFVSILTIGLSFLIGLMFSKLKMVNYKFIIYDKRKLNSISVFASIIIMVVAIYIIYTRGLPPIYYSILKKNAPYYVASGQYRNSLPFKSIILPLSLISGFISILFIKKMKKMTLLLSFFSLFVCVGIYDSRHMLIWIMIYLLLSLYPNLPSVSSLKKVNKKIIFGGIILIVAFYSYFIFIGDARVGLDYKDSKIFALSMGVDYKYASQSMPMIWGIIYLFSDLANGISNDSFISFFNTNIPKQMFPGFLQELADKFGNFNVNSHFSMYRFGYDGWHELFLNIGLFSGIVTILFLVIIEIYIIQRINEKLLKNQKVAIAEYIINLYILSRLFLLPFGCYIFDLGGYMECIYLIIFFKLSNIQIVPNNFKIGSIKK